MSSIPKTEHKTNKMTVSHLNKDEIEPISSDDDSSSSLEDIEFDEKALRKLWAEKIEQAPAAKVIVSDAMMKEAISEINTRKSQILASMSSTKSAARNSATKAIKDEKATKTLKPFPRKKISASSTGKHSIPSQGSGDAKESVKVAGSKSHISSSNTSTPNSSDAEKNTSGGQNSNGCPLETIIQFLQAVMSKDYKGALALAKEIQKEEPENEIVSEYKVVLERFLKKGEFSIESDSDADDSSSKGGNFTDELTTSSETDSNSDGESSSDTSSWDSLPQTSSKSCESDDNAEENKAGEDENTNSKENIGGLKTANLESKRDEAHDANANEETDCQTSEQHSSGDNSSKGGDLKVM